MNPSYNLLQKHAETNKQIYTLLRFACRCDHVTSLTMNTWESAIAFLAAEINTIRMYNLGEADSKELETYTKISKELDINFQFRKVEEDIEETDLLYINTPAEGNYRAMELTKYAKRVRKFILLPNTVTHAHRAVPNIKLSADINPIGLVFGINHFIQNHDNWFILEHDDIEPGMTILVNKDNVDVA
jgi:hypothetical protein